MLFQEQRDSEGIVEGDVIFFAGAYMIDKSRRKVGLVLGIKKKDGNVLTSVSYYDTDNGRVEKFKEVLDPIEFEKFLNNTGMAISTRMNSKLEEFNYRTRTLDDAFSAHLDDEEKTILHQLFLIAIACGKDRSDAYSTVSQSLTKLVSQRI